MKTRTLINYALLLIGLLNAPVAQAQQTNKLLYRVSAKFATVKDYSVDVHIKVDMPFLRMLPINAKIYFKQKDKFKVESKSIAIVPKQSFVQLTKLIADTNSYTAMQQGRETINGTPTALINIIPISDTSDVVLGKLWIDDKQMVIVKSMITTKSNGTILTTYTYNNQINYGLPDIMLFEVDVKKFKIPKAIAADINTSQANAIKDDGKPKKGKIILTLTNYKINKGIADSFFKKN
ncbi:MAG: hypothetical protein H7331_03240 [Bacteroidia bacterium]|nr:hypothetical protein [Bacteroidia bacterium]